MWYQKQRIVLWGVVGSLLVAFAIHLPIYSSYFYLDDYKQIEMVFPFQEEPWQLVKVFDPFWTGWYYRPIQHLLFFFNFRLFGEQAVGYYLVSLAFHSLSLALLYQLGRIWGVSRWGRLVMVGLFAVHVVHQDVLGWISTVSVAVATFWVIFAVLGYTFYLRQQQGGYGWLVGAGLGAILGLLSREESLVVLGLLVCVRIFYPQKRFMGWVEWFGLGGFVLVWLGYLYFQQVRPTWTVQEGEFSVSLWMESLAEGQPFDFVWYLFRSLVFHRSKLGEVMGFGKIGVVMVLLVAGGWSWWRGKGLTRLALAWIFMSGVFLYLAIWVRFPGSLPPRYQVWLWLGVCLVVGSWVGDGQDWSWWGRYGWWGVWVLFILFQILGVRQEQLTLVPALYEVEQAREQLLQQLPHPSKQTHFFATSFPPLADYIQAMAVVWYQQPFPWPGGDVGRLRAHGQATPDFFLFHYENGLLTDLMPELRDAPQTIFLWAKEPSAVFWAEDGQISALNEEAYGFGQVIEVGEQRRYGVFVHAQDAGWAGLVYPNIVVPEEAVLQMGIWRDGGEVAGADGMWFQVQLERADGSLVTLSKSWMEVGVTEWEEVIVPLSAYAGEQVAFRLQVAAGANLLHDHGYWINPRLVFGGVP